MTTKMNVRGDGMHAYSDLTEIQQWEVTQWLIEYVEDNIENNADANWADWSDPDHIISAYEPAVDTESGELTSYDPENQITPLQRVEVGEHGRTVLNACITGSAPSELMDEWSDEIYHAGAGVKP